MIPAAALLAVAALAGPGAGVHAAVAAEPVAARVNDETITRAALERAVLAAPGEPRKKVLEGLIEESLIVQEARRLKLDKSDGYLRAVRRWRQDKAVGLIGVDTLRRQVVKPGGKLIPYPEFYKNWEAVYAALSEDEKIAVDAKVEARLQKLKESVSAFIDAAALEKYAIPLELSPEIAQKVVTTQTSWGPITLADILAEEPKNIEHVGKSTKDVLRLWQQLAREIVGRYFIVQNAETTGLFAIEGLKAEEEQAHRELLRVALIDKHAAEITKDAQLAMIDQELASWTSSYALAVEEIRLSTAIRSEAGRVAKAWKDNEKPPTGFKPEVLSLSSAWPRYTADQKKVLSGQPWGTYLPPLRAGDGFLLLHLMAASPPRQQRTLGALAEQRLVDDLYRRLIERLTRSARISLE